MGEEFRFGLKQRIFNWYMRVARERIGLLQKDLGRLVGVSKEAICSYENLRTFPRPAIQEKIAEALRVPAESIFPPWLKEFKLKAVPAAIEERSISLTETISLKLIRPEMLMIEGPEEEAERSALKDQINEELKTLKPRERKVLELRFGLGDEEPMTLEKIGREMGVTSARIRQIEVRALKKLRRPARSRKLKEFL